MNIKDVLLDLLIDDKTTGNIIDSNVSQLELSCHLIDFVEQTILLKINNTNSSEDIMEKRIINQAISLLFAQLIKSYKSGLILSLKGYYSNSTMVSRNIVEIIFNMEYILEDVESCSKRAKTYLTNEGLWSKESVKNRAFLSLDSALYKVYGVLCKYAHANITCTAQNYSNNNLSIYPSEYKIEAAIKLLNAVFYYAIKIITNYYSIERDIDNKIPEEISNFIEGLDVEKELIDKFEIILKQQGISERQIENWKKDYKKFRTRNKNKRG